jgi:hypothetical protein
MKNTTSLLAILIISIICSGFSFAQEVQVALDTEGKIDVINAKLEKKLSLFPEYSHFKSAHLYQLPDSSFVLEIMYKDAGKKLKARLPLSKTDVDTFRNKVSKRIKEKSPDTVLDQEGRKELIGGSVALSIGFYGWALPAVLDVKEGKTALALYMLTGAAGFYLPLKLTENMPVTDASTTLFNHAGTRGIIHGIALAGLIDETPDYRSVLASGMVLSIAEAIYGFNAANTYNMHAGTAEVIGAGGDFGLGFGMATAYLLDIKQRGANASMLIGSGLGYWAGKLESGNQYYTRGDAYVLRSVGMLGAYIPLAFVDLSGTDNNKIFIGASMLGAALGLHYGRTFVEEKDFSTLQGYLIGLSEVAGGLFGAGLAYLVSSENNDNSSLFLTSSAIGATGGFWLMYNYFSPRSNSTMQTSAWNFNINADGLIFMAMNKKSNSKFKYQPNLISVNFRF